MAHPEGGALGRLGRVNSRERHNDFKRRQNLGGRQNDREGLHDNLGGGATITQQGGTLTSEGGNDFRGRQCDFRERHLTQRSIRRFKRVVRWFQRAAFMALGGGTTMEGGP